MNIGRVLIIVGVMLLFSGILIILFGDKMKWFGSLPFDFKFKRESTHVYAPFGSMIILSIILSLIVNIIFRLFK